MASLSGLAPKRRQLLWKAPKGRAVAFQQPCSGADRAGLVQSAQHRRRVNVLAQTQRLGVLRLLLTPGFAPRRGPHMAHTLALAHAFGLIAVTLQHDLAVGLAGGV